MAGAAPSTWSPSSGWRRWRGARTRASSAATSARLAWGISPGAGSSAAARSGSRPPSRSTSPRSTSSGKHHVRRRSDQSIGKHVWSNPIHSGISSRARELKYPLPPSTPPLPPVASFLYLAFRASSCALRSSTSSSSLVSTAFSSKVFASITSALGIEKCTPSASSCSSCCCCGCSSAPPAPSPPPPPSSSSTTLMLHSFSSCRGPASSSAAALSAASLSTTRCFLASAYLT
mmetsp:Transcript_5357/g.13803  ORF Transcript_5357/g.13803 Transcript_5357/m.13803 type:complete len:232 (+) Transcript_5357:171-866(+)